MRKTWTERIEDARGNGGFTDEDRRKAGRWPDCACGEQSPLIPRFHDGCPMDVVLADLGSEFLDAVEVNAIAEAAVILGKIEERARGLIDSGRGEI